MNATFWLSRWWLAALIALGSISPALGQAALANRQIQPNDVLVVSVLNEPDMRAEKKVSNDGKINYFFIGDVTVIGKTIAQVQEEIRDLLNKDYLVDPQVNIEVLQYAIQMVTVVGAVNKAGPVQIPPDRPLDIVEAIAMAGDFNRTANKDRIELRRRGQNTRYKYDDLRKLTDPTTKIYLEPDDIIDIGESRF